MASITNLRGALPKIAILLIISGFFFLLLLPIISHHVTKYLLQFSPGFEAYDSWIVNEEPYIVDYYLFNCTNVHEVVRDGVMPVFDELGPYRFHQYKQNRNITHNANGTITFYYTKTYYYVKEEGTRDWSERIFNYNPVAMVIANKAKYLGYFARIAVSLAISKTSPLFVNKTAEELLFKGYEDELLNIINSIPLIDKSSIPDRFGWIYKKNDTDNIVGPFNSHSDIDADFGQILSYKNRARTDQFPGSCGELRGSLGDMNPMDMGRGVLNIYVPEICAYLQLHYVGEEMVKNMVGYRYATDRTFFDNGLTNAENKCFCKGNCLPRGVLNASVCYQDSPIYAALPNFYQADSYYTDLIGGMKPDPKKHDLFITLEPKTGKIIHAGIRFQMNLLVENIKGIRLLNNLPRMFIPILYMNQELYSPDKHTRKLLLAQLSERIRYIVGLPLLLAGVCLLVAVTFLACVRKNGRLREFNGNCANSANADERKPLN